MGQTLSSDSARSPVPDDYVKHFKNPCDEQHRYSTEIIKLTTTDNKEQQRSIVLSNKVLYMFHQKWLTRRIPIESIEFVIRSKHARQEVCIRNPEGKDLRFYGLSSPEKVTEFVTTL